MQPGKLLKPVSLARPVSVTTLLLWKLKARCGMKWLRVEGHFTTRLCRYAWISSFVNEYFYRIKTLQQYKIIPLLSMCVLYSQTSICLRPATLLKKRLWHRCFPVNFSCDISKNTFFTEHVCATASVVLYDFQIFRYLSQSLICVKYLQLCLI